MKFFRKPILRILAGILLILLVWNLWGNTALTVTKYTVRNHIPAEFSGLTIAQVSDLHNTEFGKGNRKLLRLLEESQPDLIFLTGDLLDSRRTDLETAVAFAAEAAKIAPTYYAPGNHEARLPEEYAALKESLANAGVGILENESLTLSRQDSDITITGLADPDFGIPWTGLASDAYQIVLSHRPELLETYAQQGFPLVFTGHAHGGQFRLPFVGGLYAPHQGFLPEYDAGVFTQGNTTMVVSRGLGNSLFPLRIFNRPELVVITVESI